MHFLKNFRFLNIEAKAFEAGNFLKIFKGFLGFSGLFSNVFLIKKCVAMIHSLSFSHSYEIKN